MNLLRLASPTLSRRLSPSLMLRNVHAEPNSRGLLSVYVFSPDKKRWTRASYANDTENLSAPTSLRLLTWNVDFMADQAGERLKSVLDHIQHEVFKCTEGGAPDACVILLQEIEADVIPVLLGNEWVRAHFQVTPISKWNWPNHAHYGSITLIPRCVPVVAASNLVFTNSHMARNALIVDVLLAPARDAEADAGNVGEDDASDAKRAANFRIRIGNVHLESLPQGASARPQQLALVAEALQEPEVKAGLVCGDMNAIMECDKGIASSLGLSDAFVGNDDDPIGHTWGYQPVCNYSPGRLDKILYTPGKGLLVKEPECIGIGLKTADSRRFASDHYGLHTSLLITRE